MVEHEINDLIRELYSSSRNVRWSAALALVAIGESTVSALIDTLKDGCFDVRQDATWALRKIAEKNPGNPEVVKAVPAFVDTLKDENATVRWNSAETLKKIGFEKIRLNEKIMCLIELGKNEEIVAIGKPAVPALIDALKDDNDYYYVRVSAASVLGKIKDARAVPALIDTLKDMDMRRNAVDELVKIGEPAVPGLVDALEDSDVRGKAADMLLKIGKPSVPSLIDALKNKDDRVRWIAADMLGKIEDVRAVPALVVTLEDEEWDVRRRATVALDEIIPTITETHLMELEKWEKMLMKVIEKTEGEEKKNLVDLLEKINNKRNEILEPEAKKLKPPKILKRKRKPKRRIWKAVQG